MQLVVIEKQTIHLMNIECILMILIIGIYMQKFSRVEKKSFVAQNLEGEKCRNWCEMTK